MDVNYQRIIEFGVERLIEEARQQAVDDYNRSEHYKGADPYDYWQLLCKRLLHALGGTCTLPSVWEDHRDEVSWKDFLLESVPDADNITFTLIKKSS